MTPKLPDWRRVATVAATVVFLLVLAPLLVAAVPQAVGASHSYVVLSSSMTPTVEAGDMVIVDDRAPTAIEGGDIISYRAPEEEKAIVTHRVVEVVKRDGKRLFRTKGDANEEVDPYLVSKEDLIGEVAFVIPYAGYFVQFAKSDMGLVALLVVPASILIGLELRRFWRARASASAGSDATADDSDTGDDG